MAWRATVEHYERVALPFALVATPTLLGLRFLSPRPSRHRLSTLAGTTACLAALVAMTQHAVGIAISCGKAWHRAPELGVWSHVVGNLRLDSDFPLEFWIQEWFREPPWSEGLAVAAAWPVLAFGGRLRAEPIWIDRAGRLLGAYFLFCIACHWTEAW